MLKRIFKPLLILTFLFVRNYTISQKAEFTPSNQVNVEVGAPYPVFDGAKYYFTNGESILAVKMARKKMLIQKFNTENSTQESSKVYENLNTEFEFYSFIEINKKLYILLYKSEGEKFVFFAEEISYESGTFTGNKIELNTYDKEDVKSFTYGMFGVGKYIPSVSLISSNDGKKFMMYYNHKPAIKDNSKNFDKYTGTLFNENLEKQWTQTVQLPYTEELMNNVDIALDNEGELYILTEVFKEKTRKRFDESGNAKFKYSIVKINESGLSENTSDINFKGKKINQSSFFEDNNGDLILAGIYGNKRETDCDGIYTLKINKDAELLDLRTFEIPTELFKQYISERAQKKIDKKTDKGDDLTWDNLKLRAIFYQNDGSIIFHGETFNVVTTYDSKGNSRTTYYYQSMLAAKVNKEGELEWMKKLPKNVVNGDFSLPLSSKDYQYVLFIDNPKNLNLTEDQFPAPSGGNNGILTAYKISNDNGNVEKLQITNFKNVGGFQLYQFATNRIIQYSDSKLFVECYKKGKQDVMLKIEMKE